MRGREAKPPSRRRPFRADMVLLCSVGGVFGLMGGGVGVVEEVQMHRRLVSLQSVGDEVEVMF